ncbi:hypothetical protein K2X30_05625 [bacterium]|nr:hypothetical protein [bacterium]
MAVVLKDPVKRVFLNTYCVLIGLLEGACGQVESSGMIDSRRTLNWADAGLTGQYIHAVLEWHSKGPRQAEPAPEARNQLSSLDEVIGQMDASGLRFSLLSPNATLSEASPFYTFNLDVFRNSHLSVRDPRTLTLLRQRQQNLLTEFDTHASKALGSLGEWERLGKLEGPIEKVSDDLRARLRAVRYWDRLLKLRDNARGEVRDLSDSLASLGVDLSVVLSNEFKLSKQLFTQLGENDRPADETVQLLLDEKMKTNILSFASAKRTLKTEMGHYLLDCLQFRAQYEPFLTFSLTISPVS